MSPAGVVCRAGAGAAEQSAVGGDQAAGGQIIESTPESKATPSWFTMRTRIRFPCSASKISSSIKRHRLYDRLEFGQHVRLALVEVAGDGLVFQELGEVALGQHQIEDVLSVGLLDHLVLPL